MPTLSATQLEGSKPQLVAGLVAGTTDEYAVLKVNADGSVSAGGAAVISVATHTAYPTLNCLQFVNVVMAFDTVVQDTLIYDTDTGIFTIPSNGTYLLEYVFALPIYAIDWYSGSATVLLNGIGISGLFPTLASDAIAFVSSTIFNAVAGDKVKVTCIINTATGDPYPVFNGAIIKLVKL